MRILVLQLARFGDLYQTWPTLNALRRLHPEAEVHVLARARFAAAARGEGVTVHALPTAEILAPIVQEGDEMRALGALDTFLAPLLESPFDLIINLTFSPASSFLTDLLTGPETTVRGYTRHVDGSLAIPDDASAYFHAQVGTGRANRYHLTHVFAAVSGVDLSPEDFRLPEPMDDEPRRGLVIHLGASVAEKAYPPELWIESLKALDVNEPLTLIGSANEVALAAQVAREVPHVRNLVGQTDFVDLGRELARARLLIGADSAPVHIAALTGTPVLNLSCAAVSFWETGPLTPGSRVLWREQLADLPPAEIAAHARALLARAAPPSPCFERVSHDELYVGPSRASDDFRWALVQALYTGSAYPDAPDDARLGFQRAFELAGLALNTLAPQDDGTESSAALEILASVDQMLAQVARLSPLAAPVVEYIQTQKLRIPPGSLPTIRAATRTCFEDLRWITAVYQPRLEREAHLARGGRIAHALREWDFASVTDEWHAFVAELHQLAEASTKVGELSWSAVLGNLEQCLASSNYLELADWLEFEWPVRCPLVSSSSETLGVDVIS